MNQEKMIKFEEIWKKLEKGLKGANKKG